MFIDTNVLKFSATGPLMFIPVNKKIRNWYGRVVGMQVSRIGYVNRNEKIKNAELKREVNLLSKIAELAKSDKLEIFLHRESIFEGMGLPAMASASGNFFGAPITDAEAPIRYGRTLFYPRVSPKELALDFLKGIDDKRFKELQKGTGAYQGGDNYNLNQLLDAFYIWCAEYNRCEYMLTLDFKLIKMIRSSRKHTVQVKLVKPSELLEGTGNPKNQSSISKVFKPLRWLSVIGSPKSDGET